MDQPGLRLVHSKSETIWVHNDGPSIVFYGLNKKDPVGKIEPGQNKRILKNSFVWSARGQANVRYIDE